MSLTIPLGHTYPVSPNLSFGLTLTGSSNGWDFDDDSCVDSVTSSIVFSTCPSSPSTPTPGFAMAHHPGQAGPATAGGLPSVREPRRRRAHLLPRPPPRVSRGRSPAQHLVHPRFHPTCACATSQPGSSECTAAAGGSADCYRIEFPGGTIHEFHDFSSSPPEKDWRLTRMEDRFEQRPLRGLRLLDRQRVADQRLPRSQATRSSSRRAGSPGWSWRPSTPPRQLCTP